MYGILFFIRILAESNRVPFDLPEAESESVAGFITEYPPIYYSLILSTEYASIIAFFSTAILLFSLSLTLISLGFGIFLVRLIRSTLNRLKFDELMTNAWNSLVPIIFLFLFFSLILFHILFPVYFPLFISCGCFG
ncbi:MAG: NADH-quinone oxidoreductase subunit H [Desulfobacterales bacterium]|nr:NADH-quinone oxidoreductase subunit H [Desulfobacterales bacterium]